MGFAKPVTIAFGRTTTFVLLASVLTVAAVSAALVVQAARTQDDHAAEQTRHFARVLLTNKAEQLADVVVDYADWGDAYAHLHQTIDIGWAWNENNLGRTLSTDLGIETFAVFDGADRQVYAVREGELASTPVFEDPAEAAAVRRLLAKMRALPISYGRAVNAVAAVPGGPVFLSATAIGAGDDPTVTIDQRPPSILVFADRLSPAEVARMGREIGLVDLAISQFDGTDGSSATILDTSDGHTSFGLDAALPKPGSDMLAALAPWAAALFVFASGIGIALSWQGRRIARQGRELAKALRAANAESEHRASHDMLTGLSNRASFHRALTASLTPKVALPTLLYMDLDRFKAVNDGCGHDAGDAVLREVSDRIRGLIGPQDRCARIGGDEFVILAGETDLRALQSLCRKLITEMSRDIEFGDARFCVGASIGVAVAVRGDDAEQLIQRADRALYAAKAAGRSCFHFAPIPEDRKVADVG